LNRNFDVFWGTGSSNSKCAEDYHGSGPASEPEVAGIQNYMLNLKNRIGAIDIHSYGKKFFHHSIFFFFFFFFFLLLSKKTKKTSPFNLKDNIS